MARSPFISWRQLQLNAILGAAVLAGCGLVVQQSGAQPSSAQPSGEPSERAVASDSSGRVASGAVLGPASSIERFRPSELVVKIEVTGCGFTQWGTGSIVGGQILTNRHVLDGATGITVVHPNGERYVVQQFEVADSLDLAALPLNTAHDGFAWGTSDDGPLVMVGVDPSADPRTTAVVVDERLVGQLHSDPGEVLMLDTKVEPGNSGSGVSTPEGQFVGLIYASAEAGGWGLAIGVESIRAELDRLIPTTLNPGCG
jgi:S1-C subfamily serine protease